MLLADYKVKMLPILHTVTKKPACLLTDALCTQAQQQLLFSHVVGRTLVYFFVKESLQAVCNESSSDGFMLLPNQALDCVNKEGRKDEYH